LMTRINDIHRHIRANGWSKTRNLLPAERQRVINASAEEKARYAELLDPQRLTKDSSFTAMIGFGLTEDQLRTLDKSQLMALANTSGAWTTANNLTQDPILTLAMENARDRMVLRHNNSISMRITDLDAQIKAEQEILDKISYAGDKEILGCIGDLMKRQNDIFASAFDIPSNAARYTSVARIRADDTAYNVEKNIQGGAIPVGFWEIMDALFNYKTGQHEANYVARMVKTLPPRRMAELIHESLRAAGIAAIPAQGTARSRDITVALTNLGTGIAAETVDGNNIRSMLNDIMNSLRAQGEGIKI